jgi:hypothetical protein
MTNAEDAPIGNLPAREAIEAQLARILNSKTLATPDRSKASAWGSGGVGLAMTSSFPFARS